MASITTAIRPASCWKNAFRLLRRQKEMARSYASLRIRQSTIPRLPPYMLREKKNKIETVPPPPSAAQFCKEPLKAFNDHEVSLLDPNGARTRLFSRTNKTSARAGDVLRVTFREGDPFAGVCLTIRRRGPDSSILLRNHLTRVPVEMWVKIYSPNVEGIELVQRKARRARRNKLYYMRQPKHDMGSVENIVDNYLRKRVALRTGNMANKEARRTKKTK